MTEPQSSRKRRFPLPVQIRQINIAFESTGVLSCMCVSRRRPRCKRTSRAGVGSTTWSRLPESMDLSVPRSWTMIWAAPPAAAWLARNGRDLHHLLPADFLTRPIVTKKDIEL